MAEGIKDRPAYKPKTIAEQFEELCPMYMSMGMTYYEFWDGDAGLVKPYRKAYELRVKHANWEAWLYGLYGYRAFAVAYSNAWSKDSKETYPLKPIPLTEADALAEKREEQRLKMERIYGYVARQVKLQKEQKKEVPDE